MKNNYKRWVGNLIKIPKIGIGGTKKMCEDDYEEREDNESEGLILSIGKDGKAEIHKPEDYVEMKKEEAELVKNFIDENKKLFEDFCKKRELNTQKDKGEN